MNVPARCGCGHHKALHWEYARLEGCGHGDGRSGRCPCRGYYLVAKSLGDAWAELIECVAACERDWCLMDRIDLSLGFARSRSGARSVIR